jgi:hypothetical protein
MGLPFTIRVGPRQRSHSWVRVPRDSWPYFTVSDSILPKPGGPNPCIYIPQGQGGPVISPGTGFPFRRLLRLAEQRWRYSNPPPQASSLGQSNSQSYFKTGGLTSVSSSWRQAPWYSRPVFSCNWTLAVIVLMQHSLWRGGRSVVHNYYWSSPLQSFSGPSPTWFMTIFYCLIFDTPPTLRDRSRIYIPPEHGDPITPPGTGFPFRRLLRPAYSPSARTNRKHSSSIVACVSVWVPTWSLLSQSIGARAAAWQQLLSRWLFRGLCLTTCLYATICSSLLAPLPSMCVSVVRLNI